MGAASVNLPTIVVPGGPMLNGKFRGKDIGSGTFTWQLSEGLKAGTLTRDDLVEAESCMSRSAGHCMTMGTASTMATMVEALGLTLPGASAIPAVDSRKKVMAHLTGNRIVEMAKEGLKMSDILTREAFENAMSLDIAMGGSTNTVLHILAIAHEAGVDFTMQDIDALSRKVPCLCKVSPSSSYHVEDVNRAGGILGIMGELDRLGLLDISVRRADGLSLADALAAFDIMRSSASPAAYNLYASAPACAGRNLELASQGTMYEALDNDREKGCIRNGAHCHSQDGGLAVLYGNLAENGCIVSGRDEPLWNMQWAEQAKTAKFCYYFPRRFGVG